MLTGRSITLRPQARNVGLGVVQACSIYGAWPSRDMSFKKKWLEEAENVILRELCPIP